jgi:DNA-binding NarL/FixJ family response regulator
MPDERGREEDHDGTTETHGRHEPSPLELLVLQLTARGHTPEQIAPMIEQTTAGVRALLRDTMWWLGVRNVPDAIAEARRRGLIG